MDSIDARIVVWLLRIATFFVLGYAIGETVTILRR